MLRIVRLAMVLLLLLTACAAPKGSSSAATDATKLQVVATWSVAGDFAANVGGDLVQIKTLVGPGGDAHTFEPTPEDGKALAQANVILENGLGFESWLDALFRASASKAARIVVSKGVITISAQSEGASNNPEESDPHIWHDVNNAITMVNNIRDGFIQADPNHADTYRQNAEAYIVKLKQLDTDIVAQIATLPVEKRKMVTNHDTFGYFAKRYGFEIIGTGMRSVSTEAGDPSAADMAALIKQIRAAGVKAIFAENVGNPQLMQTIAKESEVALVPTLYTDALGEAGSSGATYIEMMRSNVQAIVAALK